MHPLRGEQILLCNTRTRRITMDVPVPEAQHNELGVVDPVQRLPPIRASPPSVRRSELQRRAQQKLKEATYVHVVLKAVPLLPRELDQPATQAITALRRPSRLRTYALGLRGGVRLASTTGP